ncbi:MAG: methyltransferase domain-containing protein [Planctomycetes bacterium]|nr:methyltransferase domain-containing protein [Planctomycetota bacterium]
METISGHLYDYPKYYDLIFGADWAGELKFLKAAFQKYSKRPVKSLFEPACGTGRLIIQFAKAGFEVSGNDLNEKAIAYCNQRLVRHGFKPTTFVGDMADFRLKKKVDAAFNMINTFRHLPNEKTAEAHLKCVAEALNKGGLYFLGLHLTPKTPQKCTSESWSAAKGNLSVVSNLWSMGVDLKKRVERIGVTYDVKTPSKKFRIKDETVFRTYTAEQMFNLLVTEPRLRLLDMYDFRYDIRNPVDITPDSEDIVYVLQRV